MMKRVCFLLATLLAAHTAHCGFLSEARISSAYLDEFAPQDETECLITWPMHAVVLPVTATLDQGIHTFEAAPPAGRDAIDFFFLEIGENNIMLSRTIAVPKLIATPAIFLGSYIVRWFIPIDHTDRPFGEYEYTDEAEPAAIKEEAPPRPEPGGEDGSNDSNELRRKRPLPEEIEPVPASE